MEFKTKFDLGNKVWFIDIGSKSTNRSCGCCAGKGEIRYAGYGDGVLYPLKTPIKCPLCKGTGVIEETTSYPRVRGGYIAGINVEQLSWLLNRNPRATYYIALHKDHIDRSFGHVERNERFVAATKEEAERILEEFKGVKGLADWLY